MTQKHSMSARGLAVGYGDRTVIEGLDVDFPRGQITTIIGPNGCGKSTLLRAMSRLLPANEGEVLLDGADISSIRRKDLARTISVLPQTPTAPEGLNVADLVSRGRHPHQSWIRQWSSTDEAEVHKALEMTGSMGLAERTLDSLSGGQRQRVWISMVLAQNTDILFLDEPTAGVDVELRQTLWQFVARLNREGHTVLLTTHYLAEAAHLADDVAIGLGGRIAAQGSPEDLARGEGDLTVSWIEDGAERTERTTAPTAVVRGLMSRLAGPGEEVPGLRVTAPSLEERYLELVSAHEAAARADALAAAARAAA